MQCLEALSCESRCHLRHNTLRQDVGNLSIGAVVGSVQNLGREGGAGEIPGSVGRVTIGGATACGDTDDGNTDGGNAGSADGAGRSGVVESGSTTGGTAEQAGLAVAIPVSPLAALVASTVAGWTVS